MEEVLEFTPGLQCCVRCGRVLVDRRLHDRLEEPILSAIQNEHPEWVAADGACVPCVSRYREILNDRVRRDEEKERLAEEKVKQPFVWLSQLKNVFWKPATSSNNISH